MPDQELMTSTSDPTYLTLIPAEGYPSKQRFWRSYGNKIAKTFHDISKKANIYSSLTHIQLYFFDLVNIKAY